MNRAVSLRPGCTTPRGVGHEEENAHGQGECPRLDHVAERSAWVIPRNFRHRALCHCPFGPSEVSRMYRGTLPEFRGGGRKPRPTAREPRLSPTKVGSSVGSMLPMVREAQLTPLSARGHR